MADADVIALQEANPVADVASFLADALGYDYVAQRANGGIKIGRLGIPSNLNEGLAILAKKELKLELIDVWDLSETFGLFGTVCSFHFSDRNIALVARLRKGEKPLTIINTHLASHPPDDDRTRSRLSRLMDSLDLGSEKRRAHREELARLGEVRQRQVHDLVRYLAGRETYPVILLGDFNAEPGSPEIGFLRDQGFLDAIELAGWGTMPTWDAVDNPNVAFSFPRAQDAGIFEVLNSWYDGYSRRIDHIFLNPSFRSEDVLSGTVFLTDPRDGVFASDHYGVFAVIDIHRLPERKAVIPNPATTIEGLPILTYDTDVGFGYGAKGFFLNLWGVSESFDVIAFNSTKGERWYRFVFSIPDFELRQGKEYPFSFDAIIDYDKYLKNNFFGIGNRSAESAGEVYTKEPLEVQVVGSRGFSRRLVGQIGLKFRTVRNLNYDASGLFANSLPSINHGRSQGMTLFSSFRYDSRNSFINPSRGNVIQVEVEAGDQDILSDYSVRRFSASVQTFHVLLYPRTVFAAQLNGQIIDGTNLPIHALASLGGNRTLRGYPQDRFLDKSVIMANMEIRFPLFWRFGGVAFFDAGKLADVPARLEPFERGWKTNTGIGLRFLMDTFVARADVGMSREGTGFYLNFGQAF
ncbi:MAG: BamA/TamA family outer membrane protein [Ignavibacteriales bacterium]|nr:BamA/TamA family outer membrane protein [Ignavibacteriales bacterium]